MTGPAADPSQAPDPIVGIDLGTTNSLVAWCDPAKGAWPEILPDGAGRRLVPSVVRYSTGGHVEAVGHDARRHAAANPGRTIASVKRLMGRALDDARPDLPYLSYEVVEGPNRTARIRVPGGPRSPEKIVSPQEVSAVILRALKEQASRALGQDVRRAVVTVPAYFDDAQRQATRDAGRLAGLDVIRIVNEPTAAALAYGLGLKNKTAQTIAVYDLGGGTFDVSILSVVPSNSDGADLGADFFQVLSTAGDTHLGGDDVDQMLVQHALDHAAAERGGGAGIVASPEELAQLREAAEAAKIALSSSERAEIAATVAGAPMSLTIASPEFDALIGPWAERTLAACARALRDAGLTAKDIDRVVMVGGATRTPLIRRRVAEFFGAEPYTALDPDEVVALGAAVQASIMAGVNTGSLLLDVIPLSLGIETVGGAVAKLIVRNSTVPARATEMFSTSVDGQTSIKVHVLQGEREMAADCRSLGVFHLRGIPPMPAGIPQLEVEFLVDASGVLSVSALERRSGAAATLQIVPNHGLTREEVERIEAESLAHAREDMTRHRVVDLVVNSKLDLKWIGDRLVKVGPGLDPAVRSEVEALSAALAKLVAAGEADWRSVNPDEMHKAKEALDRASIRLHELSIAKTLRGD